MVLRVVHQDEKHFDSAQREHSLDRFAPRTTARCADSGA